eukprot:1035543-Prymnesium_polylepis.1
MHPSEPPGHAADHPRPTRPIPPHTARCEERKRAPAHHQLHVARPSSRLSARSPASPVTWCGSAPPSR